MGMTIDEAMNHIKYGIIEENYPLPRDLGIEACNFAIDTMRKYQKIQEIVKSWEGDTWTDGISENCMEKISEVMEGGNNNQHN